MSRRSNQPRPPGLFTILVFFLAGVLLVLIFSHESGNVLGMANADFSRLGILLAILIFIGAGLFTRIMRPGEVFRSIAFWSMAVILLVALHAFRNELAIVGGRVLGALAPGVPITGQLTGDANPDAVVVVRSGDGHFNIRAEVNDVSMPLLLDTGASFVMLTQRDALAIDVDLAALVYSVPIRTANGRIQAASTSLEQIVIGPIQRNNIRALVAPDEALDQSLLGLSFLDTLSGLSLIHI